jgi:hypothetical protein
VVDQVALRDGEIIDHTVDDRVAGKETARSRNPE